MVVVTLYLISNVDAEDKFSRMSGFIGFYLWWELEIEMSCVRVFRFDRFTALRMKLMFDIVEDCEVF